MPRSPGVLPPFQSLYDAHRDVVWRFIVSVVGHQEAPDVFQETWLAALRAYPDLRNDDNLLGWLLTIAQRKAVDEHRARVRRAAPTGDVPERPASRTDDADVDAGLWSAVRCLPAKQRAAIAHRYVADLSYAEVGAVMGTTAEAARRNVHEALRKLRTTWPT